MMTGFPGGSAGKESACNAGDLGSIPGLGRCPGEGKCYPLQYPGLENSMDCRVRGDTKSRTRLSDFHFHFHMILRGFPGDSVVKESTCQSRDFRDAGSISGSGRSPRGGNGNSLQYSCLENPVDQRILVATVHRIPENRTRRVGALPSMENSPFPSAA